jgi:hypothetical protein
MLIQNKTPVTVSTIDGTGNMVVTDTLALHGSAIDVPVHNGGVITATVANYLNRAYTNDAGSILRLSYTSNAGAVIEVDSGFTNNGLLELVNTYSTANTRVRAASGSLVNSPTGTIAISGTTGWSNIETELNNQGAMELDWYLRLDSASAAHVNSGTINLTGGNLVINQSGTSPSFTNTGTMTIDSGYTLDINGGAFNNEAAGTLAGDGTIDMAGGVTSFTNAGIISPGSSPGALTITGMDMVQEVTSLINIEIESPTGGSFDSLSVAGNVTKGGILNVDLYNGYFPTIGDSIPFLSATAVSSDFDSLDLQIGGIIFDTVSSADLISLVCIQADNLDPTISLAATQSFGADDSVQIDLLGASDDPEYPDSLLTFGYSADNDSLLVTIDTADGLMMLKSDLGYSGTVELIVSVSDPGAATGYDTVAVTIDPYVSVDEGEANLPGKFALEQNYPNPFNPQTVIEYSIPSRNEVVINVFNVLGQRVRTFVEGPRAAGTHRVVWDGRSDAGVPVASGIYLYRLQAGEQVRTRKMLLIK